MARMTANRPTRRIRGKNKISGPRKPKERNNEPSGPIWPASPWKERGMVEIGTQWTIRAKAFVWTMAIPRRDEKGNASPKDKHYSVRVERTKLPSHLFYSES